MGKWAIKPFCPFVLEEHFRRLRTREKFPFKENQRISSLVSQDFNQQELPIEADILSFFNLFIKFLNPMKVSLYSAAALAAILTIGLSSCEKDSTSGTGKVAFEITDAPIDDANIQSVFVTVTAVKVDGELLNNFSGTQTIDLLAYQNGQVKALGTGDLSTGTHSDIRLVLDYDTDANGASPGCYVLAKNGVKHALKAAASASNEIQITGGSVKVDENTTTTAVVDVDLRKAIKYGANGASSAYAFVTDSELNASARLTAKTKTGKISGQCNDGLGLAGNKIVVYAYKKGTFSDSEKQPQGTSGIMFKNAVSSTACDANGNYTLSFLEAGDYELHFVGYQDLNNDGKMEEKGSLVLQILNGLDLTAIRVTAQATIQVDVTVTGIIPL